MTLIGFECYLAWIMFTMECLKHQIGEKFQFGIWKNKETFFIRIYYNYGIGVQKLCKDDGLLVFLDSLIQLRLA